jgi:HSP20 family protein
MRFEFPWPGEVSRLQDEMERLFGDGRSRSALGLRAFPAVNMWEDTDNLYVETELPGMELEDIEVFASDESHLTLQGERKQPAGEGATPHRQERGFGRFSRIIELPMTVDASKTSADYKAGVLRVTLPKREEAKPRRISVNAG